MSGRRRRCGSGSFMRMKLSPRADFVTSKRVGDRLAGGGAVPLVKAARHFITRTLERILRPRDERLRPQTAERQNVNAFYSGNKKEDISGHMFT